MATKRIMLLGAGGQVGQALRAEPMPAGWEFAAYSRAECDITDHRAVHKVIQTFRPDLVINAAAMTAVDKCETEQDKAVAANFEGPANLAAQCSAIDAPLIHISTDYVFDGRDGEVPYKPNDAMNPLNIYGNTKMMGEESVRHELAFHVILRISSVFSAFSTNLLTKTLQMLDTRDEIKSVIDQKSCPTYAPDIAKAIIVMTNAILGGKSNGFGTFHLCGTPPVTRFEFTQTIMEAYAPFTQRRPTILPAKSTDFPGFAERPSYSALDCSKTADIYGIAQKPWRDGITTAINMLMQQRKQTA
jgi:dTDP-4-dehydrorhamnose reductase